MKHIEPVTLTVTLTGRKAAAFRRMCRCDGLTEQEAANESISSLVAGFTESEAIDRRDRQQGITHATRHAEIRDQLDAYVVKRHAELVSAGGAR